MSENYASKLHGLSNQQLNDVELTIADIIKYKNLYNLDAKTRRCSERQSLKMI